MEWWVEEYQVEGVWSLVFQVVYGIVEDQLGGVVFECVEVVVQGCYCFVVGIQGQFFVGVV